jgi:hypothetical protein
MNSLKEGRVVEIAVPNQEAAFLNLGNSFFALTELAQLEVLYKEL